ncbi:hypothetical protein HBH74_023900 [Parastagonospora nodorum]|nr:hypothetical protein HBH74_023900 [Parastagonospora nodorum]KAH6373913.1 hypothetical protein HBI34_071960 [Parastagonospora nodorum]
MKTTRLAPNGWWVVFPREVETRRCILGVTLPLEIATIRVHLARQPMVEAVVRMRQAGIVLANLLRAS